MPTERYPKIAIRSKNDLAKRIAYKTFSQSEALDLINNVLNNFDSYWKDAPPPLSEPEKGKHVRNAKRTPLGKLLKLIDARIFQPHDVTLPSFIFGGVRGKDHIKAAKSLIGQDKYRTELKLDLKRFFEHVPYERVLQFFVLKTGCSKKGGHLLARLCCVPIGKKGTKIEEMTIARGFATSSRLAIWCNLDFFIKLNWLVKKELKGYDPRVAIYVDDMGITASRVSRKQMKDLSIKIDHLFNPKDGTYCLPLNDKKTEILTYQQGMRILGTIIRRNKLSVSDKTSGKLYRLKRQIASSTDKKERNNLKKKRSQLLIYKRYVENI